MESTPHHSLQHRRERYFITYVWKILEGHVINLSNPILSLLSPRKGHYCETSHVNHCRIGSLVSIVFDSNHVDNLTA